MNYVYLLIFAFALYIFYTKRIVIAMFNLEKFKNILGISESSGNYQAIYYGSVNAYGKYQFIQDRIDTLKKKYNLPFSNIENFLNSPEQQELYFKKHIDDILEYIAKNDLQKFEGKIITGANKYPYPSPINIYGLVAGAHLAGSYGLKKFLQSEIDAKDSLGTYVSDYVSKFSANTVLV